MFDAIDRRILQALQANARVSNADLSRDLGMAPSAILERVRKLEQRGIVLGYEARLAPRAVGLGLTAFVFVRADDRIGPGKSADALIAIPEVQEVHNVAGEDCYLVKLRTRDTDHLARVLRDGIAAIPTILSTKTTIVLTTMKETARLALHQLEDAADADGSETDAAT
ncbi:MAG: Lrp/AsnC family transcriptional regulator [Planctomycetes bacterium]|nr:Lrp/AsnC family transcriptional regulator [Planctomycetota bacterium]